MTNGTPLPAALSGVIVQRLIEIDQALLYLITGALDYLVIKEPLEQTGALTPETAQTALSVALEVYLNVRDFMTPAGTIAMWTEALAPDGWLLCDGSAAFVVEWPQLFDLWGYKYGGSGTQFGLPDMADFSPMGAGGNVALDGTAGEITHLLTIDEMPTHDHMISLRGSGTASGSNNRVNAPAQTTLASNVVTDERGGSDAHNNLHPVFGVNFIVYGGRA